MIYQSSYDVGGEPAFSKKTGFNKDFASDDSDKPVVDGTAAVGVSEKIARADHVHPTDTTRAAATDLANKVDKVDGYGLSEKNFSSVLLTKLTGIEDGADVNVQSDWNETDSTKDEYIQNKPEILAVSGYTSSDEGNIAIVKKVGEEYKLQVASGGTSTVTWDNISGKPSTFTPSTHASTHGDGGSDEISIDASQITTGTIDVSRLPAVVVPTLVTVANQAERFALTIAQVQNGDSVYQTDTEKLYMVKDDTKLASEDGYQSYTVSITWGAITGTLSSQTDLNTRFTNVEGDVSTLETIVSGHTTSISTLNTNLTTAQTDIDNLETAVAGKVDKVTGKGLSTNDYSDEDKAKVDSIEVSEDIPFMATMSKSDVDSYGIYKVITWELATAVEGRPAKWVSTLSGGTAPLYTTRTLVVYNYDKSTVKNTYQYARTYDSNGVLTGEVPTKL